MQTWMKLTAVATSCWSALAWGQVEYHINIDQPQHHLAQVEAKFPQVSTDTFEFHLPNWRTGRYLLLPLADGVRSMSVVDSNGEPLEWKKTARGSWLVQVDEPTQVTVRYQLHADQLGDRSRHIDDSHAFLDASGVFVYNPEFRDQPLEVSLTVPESWRSVAGMDSPKAHHFTAPNYDVLIDSPIETGEHQSFEFTVDGKDYELLFWGQGNYDVEQTLEDLKKLVAQGPGIWGGYPYDRYVFMIHATSGARGATEHLNSTVIQRTRDSFAERKDYISFMSTASHEYIHTWNVKAYRPQAMAPYDYQQENYSRLLWLAEGSTSYLQNQLLLTAGVITIDEFLADVAKRIERSEATPGREIQSVADASFDNWIATGGDYARNHSVNIYNEGYLASWSLEMAIIERTQAEKNYKDLHRYLYEQHRLPKGYSEQDVKVGLKRITGVAFDDWWQQAIDSPNSLDFDAILAQVGLQRKASSKPERVDYGFELKADQGTGLLTHVRRDGPAWQAGLTKGDRVIAIDGQWLKPGKWSSKLKQLSADKPVTFSYFRRDTLMTAMVHPSTKSAEKLKLEPVAQPTDAQKAAFTAWAGIDWPW